MHFLTEDDIRARCPEPGSAMALAAHERLTPAAAEYANQLRIRFIQDETTAPAACCPVSQQQPSPASGSLGAPGSAVAAASAVAAVATGRMTHLDATTLVSKGHPRIALRGKLDTLLSSAILVQTQFDVKNELPVFLKTCLDDITGCIFKLLTAEVAGCPCGACAMGGMDSDTLHTISRDPVKFLGVDHCLPDASQGAPIALLNWLRAQVRECEVAAAQCDHCGDSSIDVLNRLSSAVYVLMLLTQAARKGIDLPQLKK